MRNSYTLLSSHHSLISNVACPDSPVQNQNFFKQKYDTGSGTHSFTRCSWDNSGLTSGGGAIHIVFSESHSSISLTVDDCNFLHCKESNSVGGGAISIKYIGSADIENSVFYDCECGISSDGPESAGILLLYLYSYPLIKSCSFISCTTGDDSGGCGIYCSNSTSPYAIDSCRFIKCKGTDTSSSEGGGAAIGENFMHVGVSNSLFNENHAVFGGAVEIWEDYLSSFQYPFKFCFFNNNTATKGNDICFASTPAQYPFLHCLSTTASSRVYNGDDNWLTHACNKVSCQGVKTIEGIPLLTSLSFISHRRMHSHVFLNYSLH